MNYENRTVTTVAGVLYILLGILCIVLRSGILDFIAYCAAFALIICGVVCLIKSLTVPGIFLLAFGALVLLTGWFMVSVLLYLIAVLMILAGIDRLVRFYRTKALNDSIFSAEGIRAILLIICGVLFLLNPRGAASILFVIQGILLIAAGVLALLNR